ncbi:MAG TPA: DUF374 domain-containing protein, partial [Planctomycetota bacterium]|nr:DUF374 domain-containing protein [Planctomycetota bacterium]
MGKALRNASAHVLGHVLRAHLATLRYRVDGWDRACEAARAHGGFVLAVWHEAIMAALGHEVRRGAVALVSPGADGSFAARLVAPSGVAAVRGSSSRGGAAGALALLRAPRRGGALVVTPDGPRGPRRVAQEGAAFVASRAGLPIVPLGVAARGALRLKSWDRFLIPLPGAAVRLRFGAPLAAPIDADRERLAETTRRVETELRAATAAACADLRVPDV